MKLFFIFLMALFQVQIVNATGPKGAITIQVDSGEEENSHKIDIETIKNSCIKDSLKKIDVFIVQKMASVQEKLANPLDFLIDTHIFFHLDSQSHKSLGKQKIKELEIKFSLSKKNSVMPVMINSFKLSSPDVCLAQSSNLEFSSVVILSDIQKKYNQYLEKNHLLPKLAGENKQKEGSKKEEARSPRVSPIFKAQRSPSYLPEESSNR